MSKVIIEVEDSTYTIVIVAQPNRTYVFGLEHEWGWCEFHQVDHHRIFLGTGERSSEHWDYSTVWSEEET